MDYIHGFSMFKKSFSRFLFFGTLRQSNKEMTGGEHADFPDVNLVFQTLTVRTYCKVAVRHAGQLSSWRGSEASVLVSTAVTCSSYLNHQKASAASYLTPTLTFNQHPPPPPGHADTTLPPLELHLCCTGTTSFTGYPDGWSLAVAHWSLHYWAWFYVHLVSFNLNLPPWFPDVKTSPDAQILTMQSRRAFCRWVSSSAEGEVIPVYGQYICYF